MKKLLAPLLFLLLSVTTALGQPAPSGVGPMYAPNWYMGYTPTPLEWQIMWSNKLGYFPGGLPVTYGGTGATTAAQALSNLGAMSNALPQASLFVGNQSGIAQGRNLTGDCSITYLAVMLCTGSGGTPFGYFATGTDASHLTGTVPAAALPNPAPSTLGGIKSSTASSHQFAMGVNTSGAVTYGQPAYADVSGLGTMAPLNIGASVLNPGTGNAESALPVTTIAGTSKTYATADLFKKWRRSNGGSVMTDTLPAAGTTGLVNGTRLNIANVETANLQTMTPATVTIVAGSGTTVLGGPNYILQPGRDLDLVYDLPNTAWRANANTSVGQIKIPALPGESGVVNDNYPPGHAFRYGMSCDGITDYGSVVEYWMRSQTLPGVTAYLPACTFNFGMNTRPTLSFGSWYAEPKSLIGLMHLIASDGTSIPTATCTMSGGSLSTVTVTFQGNQFFGPAPRAQIISGGGGNVLTGASVSALLELNGIDAVIAPGALFTVGDQVTFEHGIVLQVAAITTGGVPTSWTIINRGTASADSRPRGVGQGNQYTQVSTTSGSGGNGARMLFQFQITSSVTINSAGSGGAASCSVLFETPFFQGADFGGFWSSLNRLGMQNARDIIIENYHGVDEPTINGGLHYGGEHLDSVVNVTINNYICDNAVQNGGFSGYACLAVESEAGAITDHVNIKHALIKKADWNAVVVCDARVNIDELTILSYGRANSIISTAYCSGAPNTSGYGILVNRGMLHVGRLIINNNEQLLGTLAQEDIHIVSVGYDTNPFLFSDDKSPLQQSNQWGVTFDDMLLTNVLRGGGLVIDNTPESGVQTCDVGYGTMRVQFASSTAMTSGRAGVMVSSPASTPSLANKRCTLTGGLMEFLNTGATSIAALSPQPDGLIISASATVNASMVRFPNGGVGNLGLIQALGQFNGSIVWDQQTGIDLPDSTGSNPVFLFQGTGTAGSNFRLYGNTYTQALSTTSPIVTFDGTSQVNAGVWLNEPRNGSTIATLNTNTDLDLKAYLTGANGTGIGINYGGTLVRHRLSGFIGNFDTGLSPTSSPTCTACSASNIAFGTNTTANNALAAGFFSAGFNFSGLNTTTQFQLDTGTKTATATAGAATLNKNSGTITSESLTTAAGSTYTLTITDSQIAANDIVGNVSVALGTATQGQPTPLFVTPGSGSVVIVIKNVDLTNALNGTIKVTFAVLKN